MDNRQATLQLTLQQYAQQYETHDFVKGDPSWFMHQVSGQQNQELMAWVAQALSYGRREQFMQKIQLILDYAQGNARQWITSGNFNQRFRPDDNSSFYRLYTYADMHDFFEATRLLLRQHGSLLNFLRAKIADNPASLNAIKAICAYYADFKVKAIPANTDSSCKRLCMFLRWMVRDNSPVDLGLWSGFIDKRTLIMPLDTHVLTQAKNLGLINSQTATMSAALKLTDKLRECFPDDPLKADFALFGYGVNNKK